MQEILDYLTKEPRVAGSKRNKEIAGYLKDKYLSLDYDTKTDEHRFMGWELVEGPFFSCQ